METVNTNDSTATISISATGYTDIGSGDLIILYDSSIAIPVSVSKGISLEGTVSANLSTPGEIKIGWFTFPGMSLSDGSTIFNINFNKVNSGTSELRFDVSNDVFCQFYNSSNQKLNDNPSEIYFNSGSITFSEETSPITIAPKLTTYENENINVPVTVSGFNNIGAVSLRLEYDPLVLSYNSGVNTGGFPSLSIYNPTPGTITVSGTSSNPEGYSLMDESILFALSFTYLGGTTSLNWIDNGTSCEYAGPLSANVFSDEPQSTYYINGSIGQESPVPIITVGTIENPTICGGVGTIPLILSNVPDGNYTITYVKGSFSDVNVLAGTAVISAPSGIYNNLQIMVDGKTSELGVNVAISNPEAPDAPVIGISVQPTCSIATGSVELKDLPSDNWTIQPGNISGTGTSYMVTDLIAGTYNFTVTNANGCSSATSDDVLINEQPVTPTAPDINITQPDCEISTGSINIVSPVKEGYTYSINGVDYQKSQRFIGLIANNYNVTIKNDEGCISSVTNAEIYEPPLTPLIPIIKASSSTSFCEGDSIVLTSSEAFSYLWSTGETMQSITVKSSGNYTITITNTEGCVAVSEAMVVIVDPKPAIPGNLKCWEAAAWDSSVCSWVITGTMPIEPVSENCWDDYIFNEVTCSWENYGQKPLEPIPDNSWDVFVFNTANCSWENSGTPTVAAIPETVAKINIVCYPNPFKENLTIKYTLPEAVNICMELVEISGNRIKSVSFKEQSAGEYTRELNVEELEAGVYQLIFRFKDYGGDERTKPIRIIKQ